MALTPRSIAIVLAALIAGCAHESPAARPDVRRIISLAPSLTEIAYAIGCGGELVGDTQFDDYPPAASRLPHVADLSHVDLERVAQLAPNTIVALHDEEKEGSEITGRFHVPVKYLPNRKLDDLYADISGVGQACARTGEARALAASIRARIGSISSRALKIRARPRVLYLLGLPGFTAGDDSYLNDVIGLAGGVNVAGNVKQPYPNLSAEAILAMNPDILIVAREVPFGSDVRTREPWRSIKAVRDGRVFAPPNDDIIERPGPRVVDGLAWLAKAIRK